MNIISNSVTVSGIPRNRNSSPEILSFGKSAAIILNGRAWSDCKAMALGLLSIQLTRP
jgi:hypothetical protein